MLVLVSLVNMLTPETGFRSRATSLLHPSRLLRNVDHNWDSDASTTIGPNNAPSRVSGHQESRVPTVEQPDSPSSNEKTLTSFTGEFGAITKETERPIRTLPSQ